MPIPFRPFAALALFGALTTAWAAKEEPLPPPPPMAQAATVSLYRGHSIDIPLRAVGRAPSQLTFIIRSQPKHGTLSEIRMTGRKTAVVTYTHDDKAGDIIDSFSFAAQANDSPVSASATITVPVLEEAPRLAATPALSFGKVFVGDSSIQKLEISNAGGGILKGRFFLPAPWTVAGSDQYLIERGKSIFLEIKFTPDNERDFTGQITFSSSKTSVALSGRGIDPLEIQPAKGVEFAASLGNPLIREGSFTIRNLSGRIREATFSKPPKILGPDSIFLKPNGSSTVILRTSPSLTSSLDGDILLASEGYRAKIPFWVFAIPPILRVEPLVIDYGFVRPGRRYTKLISITNTGGSNASLTAKLPAGIVIVPNLSAAVLAPEETRSFEVALESPADPSSSAIVLSVENGDSITLPIHKMLLPAKQVVPNVSGDTPSGTRDSLPSQLPFRDSRPVPALSDISPISRIKVSTTYHEATLSWEKPEGSTGFIIERRDIVLGQPGSPVQWVEWRDVKFSENRGIVTAEFRLLPAGQTRYIRIITVDKAGLRSGPSETFRFTTRSTEPLRIPTWVTIPLVALALVAAWIGWRRLRAQRGDGEAARIAQLEKR